MVRPTVNETAPDSAKGSLVAGNVKTEAVDTVFINGRSVPVYKNGSFLAYLTLPESRNGKGFTINASMQPQGNVLAQRVLLLANTPPTDAPSQILRSLKPQSDSACIIQAQEQLIISFNATTAGRAYFKIDSLSSKTAMKETRPGYYEGNFSLPASKIKSKERKGELMIYFKQPGKKGVTVKTKTSVAVAMAGTWPKSLTVTRREGRVLSSPQGGSYWITVPSGTVLEASGMIANLYK
ncbi:MAG: hypothetical protein AABZ44_06670, partial [Elusimicrobiota bacterium]